MSNSTLYRQTLGSILMLSLVAWSENPIVQTNYTSDPAPLVYKDTVFLYTGHDEDGSSYYTMNDWRVYSSTDMVNWTDRGSPLSYKTFAWATGDAWASQCIYRNGKFYWYVAVKSGSPSIGVAVSDSPTGPFVDALGKPLIQNSWDDIDPTVYLDDDGQAYLYWGHSNLYYVKLNENMTSYSGGIQKVPMTTASFGTRVGNVDMPTLFEEGPWFYKRNGIYYMAYAAGGIPEYVAYSTSTNPISGWTYRGVIMPAQGGSFTNHPGIIDFKGKSYFFYHNGALPGGGGFTRSVSVEPFEYNADGTFPQIQMTTQSVLDPVHYLDPYQRVEAETMASSKGVKSSVDSEKRLFINQLHNGDYIKIHAVDFGDVGADSIVVSVASANGGASIDILLDDTNGTKVGTITVGSTGGATAWQELTTSIQNASGVHDVYFVFNGQESKELLNFDYWQFISSKAALLQEPYVAVSLPGIVQMENFDLGGARVSYTDNETANQGGYYRQEGVDIDSVATSGYAIGWLQEGEWTEYTVHIVSEGIHSFEAKVASGLDAGKFHLEVDGVAMTSSVLVPNTGSWTTYITISGETPPLDTGMHVLRFVVDGSYFNVDWISFENVPTKMMSRSLQNQENHVYQIMDVNGRVYEEVQANSIIDFQTKLRMTKSSGVYFVRQVGSSEVLKILNFH